MPKPTFKKATQAQARLRMALSGVSGSGKTWTALALATGLGGPIALMDTERGSASKFAKYFDFDTCELTHYSPENYIAAIDAAVEAQYAVLIIDSLSHAWHGQGGVLEMLEAVTARQKTENTFTAWRTITPHQNALVTAILNVPCHVIATLRSKTEYVMDKDQRGKMAPHKVGMVPIQRAGIEYEFDVVADMDHRHTMRIMKTRLHSLTDRSFHRPGATVGQLILADLRGEAVLVPYDAGKDADDLYGDHGGDGLREGYTQTHAPRLGVSVPPQDWDRDLIGAITTVVRQSGLDVPTYWAKTCRRCAVASPELLPREELERILVRAQSYLVKHGPRMPQVETSTPGKGGERGEGEERSLEVPEGITTIIGAITNVVAESGRNVADYWREACTQADVAVPEAIRQPWLEELLKHARHYLAQYGPGPTDAGVPMGPVAGDAPSPTVARDDEEVL